MDARDREKLKKDSPIDFVFSAMTWVVAIIAVLVVVGLVLFFWLGLGPNGDEGALGRQVGV